MKHELSDNQKWNLAGREPYKFHPQASHVSPAYRDGWNDALDAVAKYAAVEVTADAVEECTARYSGLMDKTLALINAIPRIERYQGEYLWPMNPPSVEVKGLMAAISEAALFIDANPRRAATAQAKQTEGGA